MRVRIGRIVVALVTAVALTAVGTIGDPRPAEAADLSKFKPGNIISDSIFFYEEAMTEAEVQQFLDAKVSSCVAGYTCLKDHREDTRTIVADPMCKAYQGAEDETAARIIHKVAQACGVNPQVILVTLQKEQGLVTSRAPSSRMYRSAMGYGCPDTAPCDAEYYGFFNQVYKGAWAFQRYTMPPGTGPGTAWYSNYTQYAAGKTATVLYHPNSACGSSKVFIENKATGSLYFYTPYQPNAAALAAGYGVGNSCSAYGNRNFFNYFTDWFGPTHGYPMPAEIETAWKANGAEDGPLGLATGEAAAYSGSGGSGWVQKFEGGAIYDGDDTGAYAVIGDIRLSYIGLGSRNGILGWPLQDRQPTGSAGGGYTQRFQGGMIYASAAGAYAVTGEMRSAYVAAGSKGGVLGWPKGEAEYYEEAGGGYVQKFQNGAIYFGATTGAHPVVGDFRLEYIAQGTRAGALGWPRGTAEAYSAAGGGFVQKFEKGAIYSSPAGTYSVVGDMRLEYLAHGSKDGELGWPKGNAEFYPEAGGGYVQKFQGGAIYSGANTGAVAVTGDMRRAYLGLGSRLGDLGWPRDAVQEFSTNGGGAVQKFEGGALYSSDYGTYAVVGDLRSEYLSMGSREGALGWPRENAVYYPEFGGGYVQRFQGGAIYAGDGVGAYAVTGDVRRQYLRQGSRGGPLGWPTGSAERRSDAGGGIAQPFQGGAIYSSPASTSMVTGAMETAFAESGSTGGALGWPRENPVATTSNGGGASQRFTGGAIYASDAGAFPVTGAIRVRYLKEGSKSGRLGWPTGVAVETAPGRLEQTFQHGSIRWTSAGGAVVVVDP